MSRKRAKPTPAPRPKNQGINRASDTSLSWIIRDFPQLEPWRQLAQGWLGTLPRISQSHLSALSIFLHRYLTRQKLPIEPSVVMRKETVLPDFFESACSASKIGYYRNNTVYAFLQWVLVEHFSPAKAGLGFNQGHIYRNPLVKRHWITTQPVPERKPGIGRNSDLNLTWVQQKYPQLENWRNPAVLWLQRESRGMSTKLKALVLFLEKYLLGLGLSVDPAVFLSRETPKLPDFYDAVCPKSQAGIKANNAIHDFLDFLLLTLTSGRDDHGRPVPAQSFWNPVPMRSQSGLLTRDESVHSPLPYGFIDALRRILVGGPDFKDWEWAQHSLGNRKGSRKHASTDWFPIPETRIDKEDPDCVWRLRKRSAESGGDVLEMWSPVRWVALLVKLILPLRTGQVRVLDSGEADTYRYQDGSWVKNPNRLAQGRISRSHHQGVFRRVVAQDGTISTQLYANTNKTADALETGSDKGFTFPWPTLGDETQDPFYWLEKLRNWQEKYNPISQLTHWSELDGRHWDVKSRVQLGEYPPTAFLFRMPEAKPSERHLPIPFTLLDTPWFNLLEHLEDRLAAQGTTHANGARICFLPPESDRKNSRTTHYPLHCLRVSLITALAQDGEVRPEILMKIVGHSRLLMTIYYTKFGESFIRRKMEEAQSHLESKKEASIVSFLQDTEHSALLKQAICISPESLGSAIPDNPSSRNPAGWELMADGLCLMGGNTSPIEVNSKIGGCFNGGPEIAGRKGSHSAVPGGARNCVRCRWFVTMPHYLFALQARFNTTSYLEFESRKEVQAQAQKVQNLENDRHDAEVANHLFDRTNELRQAMRVLESAMARWQLLLQDLFASQRLVDRCIQALVAQEDGMKLVSVGWTDEAKWVLEETNSELLQLSGVCQDLEVYPDLSPVREAIFRRSQLLDAALENEGHRPLFLHLPEQIQLLAGNAFIKAMAVQANPSDAELGRRTVISLIDARERLHECLGFDLIEFLPPEVESAQLTNPIKSNGRKPHVIHHNHSS